MIVLRWLRAFAEFWIDFVVGDDWTVAAAVLVGLLGSWGLVEAGLPAWWLLPVAALGSTAVSLRRAARR
ncbi:hypothetical protein [Petropleomorpha daqingensis]|uniref:Uncharacterized protein n=1 Tax=Petropleomorpha daqingensis TaxID=2026353 RepID=A0A853CK79_9ACTN|nr:hypothetical protein [Petropleomorpha daqingensis]NYJ07581.1 hypothetical protein [Petropleomorpha daqingensis]